MDFSVLLSLLLRICPYLAILFLVASVVILGAPFLFSSMFA